MDQEMDEYKTPTSSRNNTQTMVLEDETPIMSQQSQTDQEMNENYEVNQELNNESPLKKRKRNTKKKDENQDNKKSTIINKPKRRAPAITRKETTSTTKSKKRIASQTTSSDTELTKEINNEASTSEEQVKTKKSSVGRNFWSLEDDKKLADAVLVNLQDVPWSKIARENFSNRDRSGCYNRWNVIKKRLYQDINGGGSEK